MWEFLVSSNTSLIQNLQNEPLINIGRCVDQKLEWDVCFS
jgi:hypothetical protein